MAKSITLYSKRRKPHTQVLNDREYHFKPENGVTICEVSNQEDLQRFITTGLFFPYLGVDEDDVTEDAPNVEPPAGSGAAPNQDDEPEDDPDDEDDEPGSESDDDTDTDDTEDGDTEDDDEDDSEEVDLDQMTEDELRVVYERVMGKKAGMTGRAKMVDRIKTKLAEQE